MTWFIGEVAAALIPALKDDDWRVGGYDVTHHKSGYELWTANGVWFVKLRKRSEDVYPFNIIEKFVLWHYIKQLRVRHVESKYHNIVTEIVSARLGQGGRE